MKSRAETPEVSVVMPCLNEAETIEACIYKTQETIQKHDLQAETVAADNGSDHGSPEIAKSLVVRVVHASLKGYGAALIAGIEAAGGDYIVMGDSDGSYDFGAIPPFLEKLRQGYDLVMGCRFPRGGDTILPGAMPWAYRCLGNSILSGRGRLLFRSPVSDFHCWLRAGGRIYNVGNGQAMVKETTGSTSEIVHVPYDQAYEEGLKTCRVGFRTSSS